MTPKERADRAYARMLARMNKIEEMGTVEERAAARHLRPAAEKLRRNRLREGYLGTC